MRAATYQALGVLTAALLLVCAGVATASASVWSEQDSAQPFGAGSRAGLLMEGSGADTILRLPFSVTREYRVSDPLLDPRSSQQLADDHVLVADGDNDRIIELDANSNVVWSYATRPADANPDTSRPFYASRLDNGNTLIADRGTNSLLPRNTGARVYEVDAAGNVVWQYGSGTPGGGVDQVGDPMAVTRLPNGNTLIADNLKARVIEVRTEDYKSDALNHGYTTSSLVWSYGRYVWNDASDGFVWSARFAQRLDNGNTLITDSQADRVIEVTPAGEKVWQYGQITYDNRIKLWAGIPGSEEGYLNDPNNARRLANGDTLIADCGNNRIVQVSAAGKLLRSYGLDSSTPEGGSLSDPRSAFFTDLGRLMITDCENNRILEVGHPESGEFDSNDIDCSLPGVKKSFKTLSWDAEVPDGGELAVQYQIDGGSWLPAGNSGTYTFPAEAAGVFVRYKATLKPGRYAETPLLRNVAIDYELEQQTIEVVGGDTEQPGTGGTEQPATGGTEQPATGGTEQPATGGTEQPDTGGTEQPATGGTEQPATGGTEQPDTGGTEQPATGGTEQPATGDTEQPATSGTEQPATSGTEQPANGGNEQPATGGQESSGLQKPQATQGAEYSNKSFEDPVPDTAGTKAKSPSSEAGKTSAAAANKSRAAAAKAPATVDQPLPAKGSAGSTGMKPEGDTRRTPPPQGFKFERVIEKTDLAKTDTVPAAARRVFPSLIALSGLFMAGLLQLPIPIRFEGVAVKLITGGRD